MIEISVIQPATATSQQLVVEVTEHLCEGYCANNTNLPLASIAFSKGVVRIIDGLAVVPITATVTVVLPKQCGCSCKTPQVFAETFDVAFTATTANNITLTPGNTVEIVPAGNSCCKISCVKAITTLTVGIA